MARAQADSLIFDSLHLEGGLFVPSVLEQAARGTSLGQTAAEYRLPKGLTLADEQGRAFRIASALWKTFDSASQRRDLPNASAAARAFSLELLRDAFGYVDVQPLVAPVSLGDRAYPLTALACQGRVALVVCPAGQELDTPDEAFVVHGSGARRRSPYQLAQQFLNASETCAWAVVTNGRQLRLLRDAETLTRPSFLEADLELILKDQRYSDFAAVWRLFHASRAPREDQAGWWEAWKKTGEEQGEPVREGLRAGVTDALLALGTGFLQHEKNEALLRRLQSGELSKEQYFQQLLRLIYRFLFLFTVEERALLHVSDDRPEALHARTLYAEGFALRRLRERALRSSGFDRYADLWKGVRIVFRGLARGEPRLALPALGGLFAVGQCSDLDGAELGNAALLTAMRHLRWAKIDGKLAAIDYRNMGPEELGSVYESLLELVPTVSLETRRFGFVGLTDAGGTQGNARKTSGSYYTPDSLVQELLDSALEPVIDAKLAAAPATPVQALLSISVIDPACGSGHFLLGAARRLAQRLAELQATEGAVTPGDYRHALREVIAHCIYGVDRNPMAIELARTALWLEGIEPGQPLSFLDHHLVCGDALLGLMDFKALAHGIPQDAFTALTGDDKAIVKALAAENRAALKEYSKRLQNTELFSETGSTDLLAEQSRIEALPETTPAEVEAKAAAYETFLKGSRESRLAQAADLFVAAFLAPKANEIDRTCCPTTKTLGDLLFPQQGSAVSDDMLKAVRKRCEDARVLHWPLTFARIFARGRFDCVLGNPPWERIKIQEEEFFASREPLIAEARNKAERGERIRWLADGLMARRVRQGSSASGEAAQNEISLYNEFSATRRIAEAVSVFVHVGPEGGGRFPLTGVGDVNTYALFAEAMRQLVADSARAGFVVPTGIVTDDSTKAFFASVVNSGALVSLFDFQSSPGLFCEIGHARFKFSLITLTGRKQAQPSATYSFFLRSIESLHRAETTFPLSREDITLINPNTRTCPVFRSKNDAELTMKIYRNVPVLIREEQGEVPEINPWGVGFSTMFHMSNDSGLFLDQPAPNRLPLYEAKMMHQFDHRWATYRGQKIEGKWVLEAEDVSDAQKADPKFTVTPRYWVKERHVLSRLARVPQCVRAAWDQQEEAALLAAFATWIEAAHRDDALAGFSLLSPRQRAIEFGGSRFNALPSTQEEWLKPKALSEATAWPALTPDELALLHDTSPLLDVSRAILDGRSPRWLMGWRDICRATDERTVIASVVSRAAVGNNLPLMLFTDRTGASHAAALLGNLCAMVLDFVARHKVGGTHLNFFIYKQLPVLPPERYTDADIGYIKPRVLELTYTDHDLTPWARDLGYTGAPFAYNPTRRAQLRAELDAYYARLYGLTRDELRYVLDPADTHGADYPTETFRGLKTNELREFGEYRTRRLVLEAWDRLAHSGGGSVDLSSQVIALSPT